MSNKNNDNNVENNTDTIDFDEIKSVDGKETVLLDDVIGEVNNIDENNTIILNDDLTEIDKSEYIQDSLPIKDSSEKTEEKMKKVKEKPSIFRYIRKFLKLLFIVLLLGSVIAGILILSHEYDLYENETSDVTNSSFYINKQQVEILDNEGELIIPLSAHYVSWIDLKNEDGSYNVPETYINAVIDTEDKNFYDHNGVEYYTLVKGTIDTFVNDDSRGGSTITMQLGKVLYMEDWYLPDEDGYYKSTAQPIEYKLLQMAYAYRIEEMYTKDEIIENYINSVNFGPRNGVENASQYFFGHSASELTLSESALLAGLPQNPNSLNPYYYPEDATERRDVVLVSMLNNGSITQEQYDEEIQVDVTSLLVDRSDSSDVDEYTPYYAYLDIVYRELDELLATADIDEDVDASIYGNSGITVYTNMDRDLQEQMYNDVSSESSDMVWETPYIEAGAVQLDTATGAVYAIGNGRGDRGTGGTNFAYNFTRQPGSTAKPIVDYGPAIEFLEWSTYQPVLDGPIEYRGTDQSVYNATIGYYGGLLPIQHQLGQSENTPALRTFYEVIDTVGRDQLGEFMAGLGITDIPVDEEGNWYPYDAYSIGGWLNGTTPYELAGAYAAFGNGGTYNEPHTIDYIEFSEYSPYYETFGAEYEYPYESSKAMEESTAFMMTQMLDADNYTDLRGLGAYAATGLSDSYQNTQIGEVAADLSVKTGTTNFDTGINAGKSKDRWVAGYTPNVTTVLWTGYTAEYEEQGYYPKYLDYDYNTGQYGNDAYELFHYLTLNADQTDNEWLHDESPLEQPSNVVTQYLEQNVVPAVSGSTPYYFLESNQEIDYGVDSPDLTDATASSSGIYLAWSYSSETEDVEFNVYIDGKIYSTTSDQSISISSDEIADFAGCNSSYEVYVTATSNDVESSASSSKTVDYGSTDFCTESEPEETTESEETTEPEENTDESDTQDSEGE